MNTTRRLSSGITWSLLVLALAAGCASLKVLNPPDENVTEQRQRRTKEALHSFKENRDFAEFQAALGRWNRHDRAGCREALERLLKRNPNHLEARLLMADVSVAEDKQQEAFSHLKQALDAHPEDARVQYDMHMLLDATGEHTGASADYEMAEQREPDNKSHAIGDRAAMDAAGKAANSPQPVVATSDPTEQLSDADPPACPGESLRFASHTEKIAHAGGADPAASTGSAGVARTNPVRDLMKKGQAALKEGSLKAALVYFRKAASAHPHNPKIPISAATASLRHNQPDLALDLLEPVRKRFSDSAPLYRVLGVAYYRRGDYKSSQAALQQALSLDKSSALSYFLIGCTLAKLGQSESAEVHFRQARTIDPRYAAGR